MSNAMKKSTLIIIGILVAAILPAQEEFFDFGDETVDEAVGPAVDLSGNISAGLRSYMDNGVDSAVEFRAGARLDLTVSTDAVEAVLGLKADWQEPQVGTVEWQDFLAEARVTWFFNAGFLEAGYTTLEWGKGDGAHAADPVNPLDQSRGFGLDAADMKLPVPLVHLAFYTGANSMLEFVYVPLYVPIQMADEGRWSLLDTSLFGTVTDTLPQMSLADSQGGARFTFSAGRADLGFQYYYGFLPEPGYDTFTSLGDLTIYYTRYHLFALEAAVAAGPFTFRAEAGYNLTEDIAGDDATKYNNRIVYLAGFDITIPGTQLFLLAQVLGDYTLGTEGLTTGDVDADTGYGSPSHLTSVAVSIEHPFFREKMNVRLSGSWMIEAAGYYIAPEITFDISDNLQFRAAGGIYGCADVNSSPYYYWDANDYIEVGLSVNF